MKNLIKLYWTIALLFLCFTGKSQVDHRMKFISWNVWNGFERTKSKADKFVHWIEQQQPDIVALEELVDFKEADLQQLGRSYGHQYSILLKDKGYPVGVTSRYPITLIKTQVDEFWHGMLHVKIKDIDFIVTHLSPFSWKYRLKEAQQIVDYIKNNKLDNCTIIGDLNAYSPLDAIWLEHKDHLRTNLLNWDQAHPEYGNMRGQRFDYSVVSTFIAAGFDDCIGRMVFPENKRVSFPTATLYGWNWGDSRLPEVAERLDYILLSESLSPLVKKVEVHNGPELEGISDHYPVSVVIGPLEK